MSHDPLVIHLKDPSGRQMHQTRPPQREHSRLTEKSPHLSTVAYKKLALIFLGGALLIVALWGVYTMFTREKVGEPVSQSEAAQLEGVIAQVGKLMVLPTNEQPAIATVTDLNPLAGQAFFANASIGDVVLMYAVSKKAILYSPTKNKIVEVAPITTDVGL